MKEGKASLRTYSTRTLVLIGLFSAICYIALYVRIPIPSPVGNPFLHMGNMFVILAALLFNGFIGGISGSIGMGLFDALNGYGASVPKTLILKLGIGLVTGWIFKKHKKDKARSPIGWIIIAAAFFIVIGIGLMITSFARGNEILIKGVEKSLVINPAIYIFSLVLGAGLLVAAGLSKKYPVKIQYAILGAVAGIAFNLLGEFAFGVLTLMLVGSNFYPAVLASAVSLPATLINGTFSIVVAVALYIPISRALERVNYRL